jgi:hypothetical protein
VAQKAMTLPGFRLRRKNSTKMGRLERCDQKKEEARRMSADAQGRCNIGVETSKAAETNKIRG